MNTTLSSRTFTVLALCAIIAILALSISGTPTVSGQTTSDQVVTGEAPDSFATDANQYPATEFMLAPVSGEATIQFGTDADNDSAARVAATASSGVATVTTDDGMLRFDVAEDATRFVFADQPVHEDGMPAYGNAFVTQGYIYPKGTLDGTNGVLADGNPEFPDLVLGEWTCRGWFIGDGAHTTTGAWVITTQVYSFDDTVLISDGYEIADIDVPVERAITGGTGAYASSSGDGEQTLLGFNATTGANLRYALDPVVP
jgi:hypothetical protein